MEWLNDLAARFPAPREDEPADLRRRIVAELRDHLLSAFQRELLLTGNAETAQQNILVRFGDPARLARKLWFDAMWEKIMSRRIMLVALVVVVLVSLGSMGFTWFLVDQAREVNQALLEQSRAGNEAMLAEARKASGAQAAENRAANLALLAKFVPAPGAAGSAAPSMEWNPLKVRLFAEKEGGPPASGFAVTLSGHLLDTGKVMTLARRTGTEGIADFGLIRPGEHSLNVVTPWGEFSGGSVTVLPGEAQTVRIVCPAILEETDIRLAVDWPQDLAGRSLWPVCDFIRSSRQFMGRNWQRDKDAVQYLAIEPSGELINFDHRAFLPRHSPDPREFFGPNRYVSLPGPLGICRLHGDPFGERPRVVLPPIAPVAQLRWPAGTYRVGHFAIARQPENREEDLPDNLRHPTFLGGITINAGDHGRVNYLSARMQSSQQPAQQASSLSDIHSDIHIEIPEFTAAAGRLNEWRLKLPEPLVEFLKATHAVDP